MIQATFKKYSRAFDNFKVNKVKLANSEYDHTNFEALYDKHSPKNFGYILKHASNKLDAEKLLMNVYLKIWSDIEAFEGNINAELRKP